MSLSVHQRIRILIEQTSEAYDNHNQGNADYAEFAALALSDFKSALENPTLTRSQLSQMLRRGMTSHRDKIGAGTWASFMAAHVTKAANSGNA